MSGPILNIADVELEDWSHGGRFVARLGEVATRLGARRLGYNLTVLPPGKVSCPFHNHRINEEMFFVLEGEGEVRIGAERLPIRGGDVIACPPGGPETAHQLINTSASGELKYLAVSTMDSPEIAGYPDSGKFAVIAELPGGSDGKAEEFRFVGRAEQGLDYWEGE